MSIQKVYVMTDPIRDVLLVQIKLAKVLNLLPLLPGCGLSTLEDACKILALQEPLAFLS